MRRRQFLAMAMGCIVSVAGPFTAIANGKSYVVRKGDTLFEIAKRHGVNVRDIKKANGLKGDLIRVGQRLELPMAKAGFEAAAVAVKSVALRPWTTIVAHHSAIAQGNAQIYHQAHLRRGMKNGLAYHFVIGNGIDSGDGEIEVGPRWTQQLAGGHVRNAAVNEVGIGICLVGNLEERRPTKKQVASLLALVTELKTSAINGRAKLTTHRKVDPGHTLCPGRFFPTERYYGS